MERGQRRTPPQTHTVRPQRSAHPTRSANRKRRKKTPKKPWIIGAGGILLILIFVILIGSNGRNNSPAILMPTLNPAEALPTQMPEPQTSAMVDYIISTAKRDAGGPDAEAKAAAAFDWIVANVPQWYDGPEIMEQAIYNGALVEYFYYVTDRIRSDIGADTVQSVKYVYRGIETVLDDATLENIRQIKEGIEMARGD